MPLLGQSLVEYWLTHLALSGATEVRILAQDRPEQIAALVANGVRWGIQAQVIPETRELTAAQAEIKYAREIAHNACEITVLDHFPGSMQSLFTSYSDLFAGILEWLPYALTPDRVGVRECQPGIWVGSHTRISPDAKIIPPCWIGQNVFIGAGAVVGPMTIIEDRSFVEPKAEVVGSLIGPDTFVGQLAVIREAIAWGSTWINWKSNLFAQVTDAFLLSSLRRPLSTQSTGIIRRLGDLYSRNKEDLQTFWKHFLLDKEDKLSTHDKL
ncbi:MAG TPA: hypothetical protein VFW05_14895 [Verrucomicrobiae bacterium]|jgi:NDP-sugar pyrophosphorylase family protein|nr:hypothetical protein [Verrucomicrobiae bacterium]